MFDGDCGRRQKAANKHYPKNGWATGTGTGEK